MRSKNHDPSGRSPSPDPEVQLPLTLQEKETNHLQNTTPEWQFPSNRPPSPFRAFPAEQATKGFIPRYPSRGREFQSLDAILVQYFPENEGKIAEREELWNPGIRSRGREEVAELPAEESPPILSRRKEVAELPAEEPPIPIRDDSYHVSWADQLPAHYHSFEDRNTDWKSRIQRSFKDVPRPELPGRKFSGEISLKGAMMIGESSSTRFGATSDQEISASAETTANITRPSKVRVESEDYLHHPKQTPTSALMTATVTGPLKSWEEIEDDIYHFAGQSGSDWSELTKLIGPLPWPLVNVDTDAFSSQPEFRPFLAPELDNA